MQTNILEYMTPEEKQDYFDARREETMSWLREYISDKGGKDSRIQDIVIRLADGSEHAVAVPTKDTQGNGVLIAVESEDELATFGGCSPSLLASVVASLAEDLAYQEGGAARIKNFLLDILNPIEYFQSGADTKGEVQ